MYLKKEMHFILCAELDSNQRCPKGGGFTVRWNSHYPIGAILILKSVIIITKNRKDC